MSNGDSDFEAKVVEALEAIEQGDLQEMTAEDWQRIRARSAERIAAYRHKKKAPSE